MSAKRAVLLFGAFNPFTNAHLHIGRLAQSVFPEHEVIYVPARLSYFQSWKGMSEADVLSEELRFDLVRGSVEPEGFSVSDIEIKGIVNGRTWNSLQYFRQELGYSELVLCMGTDKVSELETWFHGPELVAENRFLIITRSGQRLADCMTPFTSQWQQNFVELPNDELAGLSATAIREALSRGDLETVRASVPPYVYNRLTSRNH